MGVSLIGKTLAIMGFGKVCAVVRAPYPTLAAHTVIFSRTRVGTAALL